MCLVFIIDILAELVRLDWRRGNEGCSSSLIMAFLRISIIVMLQYYFLIGLAKVHVITGGLRDVIMAFFGPERCRYATYRRSCRRCCFDQIILIMPFVIFRAVYQGQAFIIADDQ